jgi:broad specificity phosphatase PhoE
MTTAFYLTHPQVRIDPNVPVPKWGLSDVGRARAEAGQAATWAQRIGNIVSSGETKALETAEIFAKPRGLTIEIREAMHENGRSATGFLPPPEFEQIADQFFAKPDESVRGWETSRHAQARIVREAEAVLSRSIDGDLLFVGHGAVGTLLYCHLADMPIARRHDQGPGGGHVFAFDIATRRVIHAWRPLEAGAIGVRA